MALPYALLFQLLLILMQHYVIMNVALLECDPHKSQFLLWYINATLLVFFFCGVSVLVSCLSAITSHGPVYCSITSVAKFVAGICSGLKLSK